MALCDRFVFLILLWTLTLTGGLQAGRFAPWSRCAIPMIEWQEISFVTTTGDVSQARYNCNITRYKFNCLRCSLEHISGDGKESYKCQTAKILETNSVITDIDRCVNEIGPICRTDKQPKISEYAENHFICENTTTVHPALLMGKITCTGETDLKPLIAPFNFRTLRQVGTDGLLRHGLPTFFVNVFIARHRSSPCPPFFGCHWIRCGSLLLLGKGTAHSGQDLEDSLRNILKTVSMASVLTSLEISGTKFSHLPRMICELAELQHLAAVSNSLKTLPKSKCLRKMVRLKILDVSFNALETVENLMFGSQSEKTYLDLSSNHIHDISQDAFSQLENLVFLSLANNSITEIRFQLPQNLTHLVISYNKIRYLQSSTIFVKLFKIEYLNLRYNAVQTVNFTIPSALEHLDMSYNQIHIIDGDMFKNAKNLTFLLLQHNRIKSVDLGMFQKANHLEEILLQFNEISEIKDDILNGTEEIKILPNLDYMNISHNQLKVAPLSLIFLNMTQIDFSYNKIEKCTWSNRSEDNILKNIDDKISSSLHVLDKNENVKNVIYLNHNRLRSLKDVFGSASIMMYKDASLFCRIHTHHNPFHCDCHLYPYLKLVHDFPEQAGLAKSGDRPQHSFDVSSDSRFSSPYSWSKTSVDTMRCQTPSKLNSYRIMDKTILDKLECNLMSEEICEVIFKPSNNLLLLNCSNLKQSNRSSAQFAAALMLSMVAYQVPFAPNATIHLNGIVDINITNILEYFVLTEIYLKIRGIDLSHSNVSDCAFFILLGKAFPFLDALHLNDNNLTMLPFEQLNSYYNKVRDSEQPFWEKLSELHLYNNPWDCSCKNIEMKTWLLQLLDRNILVEHLNIRCATPEHLRGKTVYMLQDQDICPDSKLPGPYTTLLHGAFYIIGFIIGFVSVVLKRYKNAVKVFLFEMINDDDITDMKFDAFVSYCEPDAEWVENELIPKLENHEPPYKICQHKRDFDASQLIILNELDAIRHSRRVIIVLSKSYLERSHCRNEFRAAFKYWLMNKQSPRRVVVVKYPDVDPQNPSDEICEAYFQHYTYLAKDEHIFDRLFETMPKESLAQIRAKQGDGNQSHDATENGDGSDG